MLSISVLGFLNISKCYTFLRPNQNNFRCLIGLVKEYLTDLIDTVGSAKQLIGITGNYIDRVSQLIWRVLNLILFD